MDKTRSYTRYSQQGPGYPNILLETFRQISRGSPRKNGKLTLVANPFSLVHAQKISGGGNYDWGLADMDYANNGEMQRARQESYNNAYAAFRGKLYKGNASLGVSLGSYKQSREMIQNRSRQIGNMMDEFSGRVEFRKRWTERQSFASAYLEFVFGWVPLLVDLHSAATTVIQQADVTTSGITGRGNSAGSESDDTANSQWRRNYTAHTTVNCLVRVSNPNLWLAERAGLLNPAAVAWDLVPWSFVVNMFVNTGALVNSITDFQGLRFDNMSVTTTVRGGGGAVSNNGYPVGHPFRTDSSKGWKFTLKSRTVGSIPRPEVQMKLPKLDWSLAAIAVSLLVQKVRRLDRLLSVKNPF